MQRSKNRLLNDILSVLQTIKEDKPKLEKLHRFMMEEIYEEEPDIEIPEKYYKLVHRAAQSLDCGMVCYLNTDTLEMEEIPEFMLSDPFEFERITKENADEQTFKHLHWKNKLMLEPLPSSESYRIMDEFARQVSDVAFANKLLDVLNRRRPFSNFKNQIDNSPYRQAWFDFKEHWYEQYVYEVLRNEIEDNTK